MTVWHFQAKKRSKPQSVLSSELEQTNEEAEMAAHSSILAWRIPWTDQGLQRIGRRLRDEDFHFLF